MMVIKLNMLPYLFCSLKRMLTCNQLPYLLKKGLLDDKHMLLKIMLQKMFSMVGLVLFAVAWLLILPMKRLVALLTKGLSVLLMNGLVLSLKETLPCC
jgi:hypothetical protein